MNKSSQRGPALSQSKGNITIILLFLVAMVAVGAGAYFYGKGGLKLPFKQPASSGAQVSITLTPTKQQIGRHTQIKGSVLLSSIPQIGRLKRK